MTEEQNITEICFYDDEGNIVRRQFTDKELQQFWPPDSE
jgi:hypothetical protein